MITGINHITLAVTDIEKSFQFYRDILGLKPLCRWDKGAYFLVGDFWFCLNVDDKREPNPCYTHYAFSVSQTDFDTMSRRITQSGTTVFKDNTSPGDSLYFLDPDRHKLEIHASNWQERVSAKKASPGAWKNIEWFS
ncbi:MAG: fosfomycin resistance glutathione transferase [Proteobacteria bacterium]|nr:fosfomycin resistance glutathione transferase [Pseudomonadota bacterium]